MSVLKQQSFKYLHTHTTTPKVQERTIRLTWQNERTKENE